MSYLECACCGLTAFSAAYRNEAEHCARCGAELPRPHSGIVAFSAHPRLGRGPRNRGSTPTDRTER